MNYFDQLICFVQINIPSNGYVNDKVDQLSYCIIPQQDEWFESGTLSYINL